MISNWLKDLWLAKRRRISVVAVFTLVTILALGGYMMWGQIADGEKSFLKNIKCELALLFGVSHTGNNTEIISLVGDASNGNLIKESVATSSSREESLAPLTDATSVKSKKSTQAEPVETTTEQKEATTKEMVKPSIPPHVLISEVMAGTQGSSTNEFIEFYNPTNQEINLSGLYIKRKATAGGVANNLVSKLSGTFDGKSIMPHGFFLIGSKTYQGNVTPDAPYSQNSTFLADNGDAIILYDKNNNVINEVFYVALPRGKSWERKAYVNGACVLPQGGNELAGNGCDTKSSSDFILRDTPHPQNSGSSRE